MKKKNKTGRVIINICYPILSLAIALAIWAIAAKIKNNALVLPMPDKVLTDFFALFRTSDFYIAIFASLGRILLCFIISLLSALLFAITGFYFKPFDKIVKPLISLLRSAPTVAVILISYAFFTSNVMAVFVGFLISFPVLYSTFVSGLESLDKNFFVMAKTYKIPLIRQIFGICIPQISPIIFECSASTLSLTVKIIVSAEIITCVAKSIGGMIQVAYASFEIQYLLAWTLVAVLLSFILETVVRATKKIFVRWE